MLNENTNNLWKIFDKIVNGKQNREITLKEDGEIISDNLQIANIMNTFLKKKLKK